MEELAREWSRLTGNECVLHSRYASVPFELLQPNCVSEWRIRDCDREDAAFWLPYRVIRARTTRVYYACTKGTTRSLVLEVRANGIIITEWAGGTIVSEKHAHVESNPTGPPPTSEEIDRFREILKN